MIVSNPQSLANAQLHYYPLQDGTVNEFDGSYSLLSPFICDAIATKEERRSKRSGSSSSTEHALPSSPMKMEDSMNGDGGEHKNGTVAIPSIILLKYVTKRNCC